MEVARPLPISRAWLPAPVMMATLPWRFRVGRFGGLWRRGGGVGDGDDERWREGGLRWWLVCGIANRLGDRRLGFGKKARLNMVCVETTCRFVSFGECWVSFLRLSVAAQSTACTPAASLRSCTYDN